MPATGEVLLYPLFCSLLSALQSFLHLFPPVLLFIPLLLCSLFSCLSDSLFASFCLYIQFCAGLHFYYLFWNSWAAQENCQIITRLESCGSMWAHGGAKCSCLYVCLHVASSSEELWGCWITCMNACFLWGSGLIVCEKSIVLNVKNQL